MSAQDTVSIDTIKRMCAATFGVSVLDLVSERRDHKTAEARHVAMYLARQVTKLSLPGIGRHFGNRHHSTVMYSVRLIDHAIDEDGHLVVAISDLWDAMLPGARRAA